MLDSDACAGRLCVKVALDGAWNVGVVCEGADITGLGGLVRVVLGGVLGSAEGDTAVPNCGVFLRPTNEHRFDGCTCPAQTSGRSSVVTVRVPFSISVL